VMRKYFDYGAEDFISFLKDKEFFYVENARSSYQFTLLSMNAMLNMDYVFSDLEIKDLKNEITKQQRELVSKASLKETEVVHRFLMRGYEFHNFSIFDMHGQPQIDYYFTLSQNFIEFIFQRTVIYFSYKNLLINFDNHKRIINLVTDIAKTPRKKQSFVYGHIMLPHDPFIFDRYGNVRQKKDKTDAQAYIEQVRYTNKLIQNLIEELLENTNNEAIIILTGDHGYRLFGFYQDFEDHSVMNQTMTAIYFPNKDYSQLYDTLSSVNIFPAVLNNSLGTNIPFKKDTINYFRE